MESSTASDLEDTQPFDEMVEEVNEPLEEAILISSQNPFEESPNNSRSPSTAKSLTQRGRILIPLILSLRIIRVFITIIIIDIYMNSVL